MNVIRSIAAAFLAVVFFFSAPFPAFSSPLEIFAPSFGERDNTTDLLRRLRAAATFSEQRAGFAFAVYSGDRLIYERYTAGVDPDEPQVLASGTKSFWGVLAVALASDGLLSLDAPVGEALPSWRTGEKSMVTVRMLLDFTSGLPPGYRAVRGWLKDHYAVATDIPLSYTPGSAYSYGPSHLAVFGAYLERKFGHDPLSLLQDRVLSPLGIEIKDWARDFTGRARMAGGGRMSLRDWMRFGAFLARKGAWEGRQIIPSEWLDLCFHGSMANPAYGLTFWLNADVPPGGVRNFGGGPGEDVHSPRLFPSAPKSLIMLAGMGGQRLYIFPGRQIVVGRLANESERFADEAFLNILLEPGAHHGDDRLDQGNAPLRRFGN